MPPGTFSSVGSCWPAAACCGRRGSRSPSCSRISALANNRFAMRGLDPRICLSCREKSATAQLPLLQRHAGNLDRLAPERDLLRDEGGKLSRARVVRGLVAGLADLLDEARILERTRQLARHALDDVL